MEEASHRECTRYDHVCERMRRGEQAGARGPLEEVGRTGDAPAGRPPWVLGVGGSQGGALLVLGRSERTWIPGKRRQPAVRPFITHPRRELRRQQLAAQDSQFGNGLLTDST